MEKTFPRHMIIGDSWIVTATNTFLGMPLGLGYVVHYMMAIKSTAEMFGGISRFLFRFHKNETALRSFPGAKILSKDINPTNVTISAVYPDIGPQYYLGELMTFTPRDWIVGRVSLVC